MMRGSQATFVSINGSELYYQIAGAGPPVVLVHARLTDSRMWDAVWDRLTEHYTVIRYDLRGHGQSAMPAGSYSHVADLVKLLDQLEIGRAHLAGHSMGGEIVIDTALAHPERVASLILVSCVPTGYEWSPDLNPRWGAIFDALERNDFDGAVELDLQFWVDGPRRTADMISPAVREQVRQMDLANWRSMAEYRMHAQPEPPIAPPAVTRLSEIAAPTLVLAGTADVPDVLASADTLATQIHGAEQVILPEVGHMLPMEQPERFSERVHQFLKRQQ
jgi:pimeloyl-ACP methyl ester carboxylesterase